MAGMLHSRTGSFWQVSRFPSIERDQVVAEFNSHFLAIPLDQMARWVKAAGCSSALQDALEFALANRWTGPNPRIDRTDIEKLQAVEGQAGERPVWHETIHCEHLSGTAFAQELGAASFCRRAILAFESSVHDPTGVSGRSTSARCWSYVYELELRRLNVFRAFVPVCEALAYALTDEEALPTAMQESVTPALFQLFKTGSREGAMSEARNALQFRPGDLICCTGGHDFLPRYVLHHDLRKRSLQLLREGTPIPRPSSLGRFDHLGRLILRSIWTACRDIPGLRDYVLGGQSLAWRLYRRFRPDRGGRKLKIPGFRVYLGPGKQLLFNVWEAPDHSHQRENLEASMQVSARSFKRLVLGYYMVRCIASAAVSLHLAGRPLPEYCDSLDEQSVEEELRLPDSRAEFLRRWTRTEDAPWEITRALMSRINGYLARLITSGIAYTRCDEQSRARFGRAISALVDEASSWLAAADESAGSAPFLVLDTFYMQGG